MKLHVFSVKVSVALLTVLLGGCSLDTVGRDISKTGHRIGHGISETSQKVGHRFSESMRNRVVPGIQTFASANPFRSEKEKLLSNKVSTQYRSLKAKERRMPSHYLLYNQFSEFKCPGDGGDRSSYVSAMSVDTSVPAAYHLGNTCREGAPLPASDFPYDIEQAWLGPFMKRHLVVYRSRIWNLETEPKTNFKDAEDSFALCENESKKLAFYVMRGAGQYWGFVGWSEATASKEVRYRTSRFFPVNVAFSEVAMVQVTAPNGAVKGGILTSRSPQGTNSATFHFDGVEGIPQELKYSPLNCAVGHLFNEGMRPRFASGSAGSRVAESDN